MGITGYETEIKDVLKEFLVQIELDDIYEDGIGNLICYKKGLLHDNKIVISAHCDEVGLQILNVKEDKLRFKALGNVKCYNLYQQKIVFENGSKGIILADENEKVEKYNYGNLYIQLIDKTQEIEIGDICTFDANYFETDQYIVSKSLDNRVSCFLLYKLLRENVVFQYDTYIVFSVQEEIGLKGIKAALTHLKPDIFISVDLTPECVDNTVKCGDGVAIKISDSIGISDRRLVSEFKEIAKKNRIKYQLEVNSCGTSEVALVSETGAGFKSIGISIPAKELHTANVMVKKSDMDETYQLLKQYFADHNSIK